METRVEIQDWDALVTALGDNEFESEHYLDRETGEILFFSVDAVTQTTDEDDEPTSIEWLRTEVDQYRQVLDAGARYLQLSPTRDPWERMASFVATIPDEPVAELLHGAIHGKGAFRAFNDEIHAAGIEEQWFSFEYRCKIAEAVDYLRQNGVEPTNAPKFAPLGEATPHRKKVEATLSEVLGRVESMLASYRSGDVVERDVSQGAADLARQLETLSLEIGR